MIEKIDIPAYETTRVLVYGDLMLDRYWYGNVSRISPEAPVPVVRVNALEARPGGAANVALNIAALGSQVTLMGWVGEDSEATELQALLNNKNIECHFQKNKNFSTVTKLRVLGQNQQLLRLDFENSLENYDDANLIQAFRQQLANAHVVVLSDYAKGALRHANTLIAMAREQGIPVLVDPKADDFSRYAGATLITPNLKEFEAVAGPCQNDEDLTQKANELMQQHQIESILITRGKDGMLLIQGAQDPVNLPARAREVYDVTGAGDTVISVMAASLAAQTDMIQAATLANLAGGIVVRKLGAAVVTVPELRRELQKANDSQVGIVSEKELLLAVADARAHGETVVMTNGCFDILHTGHVQYLEEAKAMGDRLIVAVNTDDSVAELKGEDRPLNSLQARMEVLSALRSVDWVVPFSEDTPERLIGEVLPDILVKGGDYKVEEIAGHEAVLNNGGKVLTVKIREGYSTTGLLEKIRGTTV
ncbi:bifunctional D-glycero-beta-D-manno-heptose-7-phosphate kinase/D-glycero-beta-D-manno-heptose 1-phosphate adenylyltransferase HldE [Candidiatus Paracoxiella cheracis]|uniref:bifunctional D-glycero-beta-D-manno-heptose-7-phosphate kinase/D-glycero-beta-D-manno-heptose 1-phosphate adenylyltransferase HldE n=1 Tax=Candidiatus Paracoxiella cheracis TaxID=3405120 RepID=UPI003BF50660